MLVNSFFLNRLIGAFITSIFIVYFSFFVHIKSQFNHYMIVLLVCLWTNFRFSTSSIFICQKSSRMSFKTEIYSFPRVQVFRWLLRRETCMRAPSLSLSLCVDCVSSHCTVVTDAKEVRSVISHRRGSVSRLCRSPDGKLNSRVLMAKKVEDEN